MKVTILLPKYPHVPVGGLRVAYEYANGLAERGHDVSAVHTWQRRRPHLDVGAPRWRSRLKRGVIDQLRSPIVDWMKIDRRVRMRFVPLIEPRYLEPADVIVATAWWTAYYMVRLEHRFGQQLYLIQHLETWSGPTELVAETWRYPTGRVVTSRWLYDIGLLAGVPPSDMRHLPLGIDHDHFRSRPQVLRDPRAVSFLVHENEWKGTREAIAVARKLRESDASIQFRAFGTGGRRPDLPAWIEYHQNPSQEDLATQIYGRSTVFLSTSWYEGWGLPGAEAMASGCAVVSTDSGGVRDYAIDGETALLADPGDVETLTQHVRRILDDDPLRSRLIERGTEHISGFTWAQSIDAFEEFMRDRVQGH